MTKTQMVLKHLESGRSITSLEAFREYGATRLSAIIFNLRNRGYDISSTDREELDRTGSRARFVEYRLHGRKENNG